MQVRDKIWCFPSPKTSEGVISWWLDSEKEPLLIDCPDITTNFLETIERLADGRKPKILLTNKYSHKNAKKLTQCLKWPLLVQEQEAYLLPGLNELESFSEEFVTSSGARLLWTPGPTPGSCVVYAPYPWNVLFCGRLLIPVSAYEVAPVRTKQTFHWTIQQKSISKLREWLPSDAFPLLGSGVNADFLPEEKLLTWSAWQVAEKP